MPNLLANHGRWPADIALWRVDVDLDDIAAASCTVLSRDERDRMERYTRHEDRVRFAAARSSLRVILGEHVARDPAQLTFETGDYGRPSLAAFPDVSFNVSHSGARVLIAVSTERTVGVDIEEVDPALDWRALLVAVCTSDESFRITNVQDFYGCWTAKEALLKATGVGIAKGDGLKSIDLAAGKMPAGFRFAWIHDFDGYAAALAFGIHANDDAV